MARARKVELRSDGSYAEAAAETIAVRAGELVGNAANVLDTDDIERVHDMRVATRRLRAALEVFEPCFPAKRYRAALGKVKDLADALGERRDRDVTIAEMRSFAAEMPGADQRGIDALIARLRAEQAEANEALAPMVAGARIDDLHADLLDLAEASRDLGASPASADGGPG